jgi:predicted TIM-barrel fold metal-dependent hydrolase
MSFEIKADSQPQFDNKKQRMFNTHAHCFTISHVPDYFARGYTLIPIRISQLIKWGVLKWAINKLPSWARKPGIDRLITLLKFMDMDTQEKIFKNLMQFYPLNTGLVMLTMDMEYMQAEAPPTKFRDQLEELANSKSKPELKDILYPFVFVDPRRVAPKPNTWEVSIENTFIGEIFLNKIEEYVQQGIYQGIKLYPAIGYFPFDIRLRPVYDLALKYDLPIISHVIEGVVHFRGEKEYPIHPFTQKPLPGKSAKEFQAHFTHPLNFEILLNPQHLSKHWNIPLAEAEKYGNLKICMGHFGGEDEWVNYIRNPWLPSATGDFASLELDQWNPGSKQNYSWFNVCCDLMRKYPNVYADISYTGAFPSVYNLLKIMLQTDDAIHNKTLFGTDFYVVSKAISEREFALNIRAALGEDLFKSIAQDNPIAFLTNRINQVPS